MQVAYTDPHYCDIDRYNCLMPVEYQLNEEDKKYHKVRMACHGVLDGTCKKQTECEHFLTALETVDVHLLREVK